MPLPRKRTHDGWNPAISCFFLDFAISVSFRDVGANFGISIKISECIVDFGGISGISERILKVKVTHRR